MPYSLLGRDLLSQLQTTVKFGEPNEKVIGQEGTLLLARSACLNKDKEKTSFPPHSTSQGDAYVWDIEVPGTAVNIPAVQVTLKPNVSYPWKKQYPLRPEDNGAYRPWE